MLPILSRGIIVYTAAPKADTDARTTVALLTLWWKRSILSNLFAIARVIVTGRSDNSSVRRHTSLWSAMCIRCIFGTSATRKAGGKVCPVERPADVSMGIDSLYSTGYLRRKRS